MLLAIFVKYDPAKNIYLKDLLAQLAHLYAFQVVAKAVLGGC